MTISTLAPWFGSNRMLGDHVGKALSGCTWVGVPFAGGMSELPHVTARTILVNDLHRLVINLARVVADDNLRPALVKRLEAKAFHPDELVESQRACRVAAEQHPGPAVWPSLTLAEAYFVCCWMGRSGKAGTKDEFNGRTATRWNAGGGDSAVRYHSAIANLKTFSQTLKRCTFETMDAFAFLDRCNDRPYLGLYCDPPFPDAGNDYAYNCGKTQAEQRDWHTRLAQAVSRFKQTCVVMRFHSHPLIWELYDGWDCMRLEGRSQANKMTEELLLIRNG